MSGLLTIAFVAVLVWIYAQAGVWVGLLATAVFLIFLYAKTYADICVIFALRKYTLCQKDEAFMWFERGYKHGMKLKQKVTYAYYLLREGNTEKSEEILSKILAFSLKPEERCLVKSHHALVLMKTGRLDEALEELLEIFPYYRNTTLYGNIGYIYIVKEDMEEAEKFNLEAYDFNSDDCVILDNLIQLYNLKGEYEKAFEYVEKIMSKDPEFIEAYYNSAITAKALGKTDLAIEYLKKTKEIKTSFMSNVSREDVEKLLEEIHG